MVNLLLVGLGGFVGAVARYIAVTNIQPATSGGFPWGTLTVNISGCLLIGLLIALLPSRFSEQGVYLFLIPGLLGGFTTFSAFGLEAAQLLETGRWLAAIAYVGASVAFGLAAVFIGLAPGRL